jgi:hypothetical protein
LTSDTSALESAGIDTSRMCRHARMQRVSITGAAKFWFLSVASLQARGACLQTTQLALPKAITGVGVSRVFGRSVLRDSASRSLARSARLDGFPQRAMERCRFAELNHDIPQDYKHLAVGSAENRPPAAGQIGPPRRSLCTIHATKRYGLLGLQVLFGPTSRQSVLGAVANSCKVCNISRVTFRQTELESRVLSPGFGGARKTGA